MKGVESHQGPQQRGDCLDQRGYTFHDAPTWASGSMRAPVVLYGGRLPCLSRNLATLSDNRDDDAARNSGAHQLEKRIDNGPCQIRDVRRAVQDEVRGGPEKKAGERAGD